MLPITLRLPYSAGEAVAVEVQFTDIHFHSIIKIVDREGFEPPSSGSRPEILTIVRTIISSGSFHALRLYKDSNLDLPVRSRRFFRLNYKALLSGSRHSIVLHALRATPTHTPTAMGSGWQGSNLRPLASKASHLPADLTSRFKFTKKAPQNDFFLRGFISDYLLLRQQAYKAIRRIILRSLGGLDILNHCCHAGINRWFITIVPFV